MTVVRTAHTLTYLTLTYKINTMGERKPGHTVNECYEALLDLKSIFPTWSDTQDNFHFHWRQILSSTTKGGDVEEEIIGFYSDTLKPLIDSRGEGIEAQKAFELVAQLDHRRKEHDEAFDVYKLEEVLGKDTTSIKPKPPIKKQPVQRRPAAEVTTEVLPDAGHVYGTRARSRQLQTQDVDGKAGKLEYNTSGFGTHLKRGIFSDYVWDFLVPTGEVSSMRIMCYRTITNGL